MSYQYEKFFDASAESAREWTRPDGSHIADRRDGLIYRFTAEIELAVNVALVTGRPLLVRGRSGCGKSSLARCVANKLGRRYYEIVVTSRTQAADFLYRSDLVRRLNDAQAGQSLPDALFPYVDPGKLWWAFDPASAARRGGTEAEMKALGLAPLADPAIRPVSGSGDDAVVLIDEIDKADPDVPNDLLVPLGSFEFNVPEIDRRIATRRKPFLILTSNEERSLSPAFLRRCVELAIPSPAVSDLVEIGEMHFPDANKELLGNIAAICGAPDASTRESDPMGIDSPGPSVAEFLDLTAACIQLKIEPDADSQSWEEIRRIVIDRRGTR